MVDGLNVSDRITSNDKIRKRNRKLVTLLLMTALLSPRGCRKCQSNWPVLASPQVWTREGGDPAAD